jgi:hypothetical protein
MVLHVYKKLATAGILTLAICSPGYATNNASLDELTVVRTQNATTGCTRHNIFLRSDAANPRDGTSQVSIQQQLPNVPFFAPQDQTEGVRINGGVINFPFVLRVPGQHFGGNLPPEIQEQLRADNINPTNLYMAIVAQDMPYSEQTRMIFKPHTYLYPNAPSQQEGYDQQQDIQTTLFDVRDNLIHFVGRENGQMQREHIRVFQQNGATVLSAENGQVEGISHLNPMRFFSYTTYQDNNTRAAIVCCHLLLKDNQCQALQNALITRTIENLSQRSNLIELLRVIPQNVAFQGFNGLQRALGLFRYPSAFVSVQMAAQPATVQRTAPAAVPATRQTVPMNAEPLLALVNPAPAQGTQTTTRTIATPGGSIRITEMGGHFVARESNSYSYSSKSKKKGFKFL